jgi:hypothetical protein
MKPKISKEALELCMQAGLGAYVGEFISPQQNAKFEKLIQLAKDKERERIETIDLGGY